MSVHVKVCRHPQTFTRAEILRFRVGNLIGYDEMVVWGLE